jgi:hypothetical protein
MRTISKAEIKLRNARKMYEKGSCLGIRCERCPLTNPRGQHPCRWVAANLLFLEPSRTKRYLFDYIRRETTR